jgi:hypothetical protein
MPELTKTRTAYIKAPAGQAWQALTSPVLTIQDTVSQVRSTWRRGDQAGYLVPGGDEKTLDGRQLTPEHHTAAGSQVR